MKPVHTKLNCMRSYLFGSGSEKEIKREPVYLVWFLIFLRKAWFQPNRFFMFVCRCVLPKTHHRAEPPLSLTHQISSMPPHTAVSTLPPHFKCYECLAFGCHVTEFSCQPIRIWTKLEPDCFSGLSLVWFHIDQWFVLVPNSTEPLFSFVSLVHDKQYSYSHIFYFDLTQLRAQVQFWY